MKKEEVYAMKKINIDAYKDKAIRTAPQSKAKKDLFQ